MACRDLGDLPLSDRCSGRQPSAQRPLAGGQTCINMRCQVCGFDPARLDTERVAKLEADNLALREHLEFAVSWLESSEDPIMARPQNAWILKRHLEKIRGLLMSGAAK